MDLYDIKLYLKLVDFDNKYQYQQYKKLQQFKKPDMDDVKLYLALVDFDNKYQSLEYKKNILKINNKINQIELKNENNTRQINQIKEKLKK
jgi:hypothetical protein